MINQSLPQLTLKPTSTRTSTDNNNNDNNNYNYLFFDRHRHHHNCLLFLLIRPLQALKPPLIPSPRKLTSHTQGHRSGGGVRSGNTYTKHTPSDTSHSVDEEMARETDERRACERLFVYFISYCMRRRYQDFGVLVCIFCKCFQSICKA